MHICHTQMDKWTDVLVEKETKANQFFEAKRRRSFVVHHKVSGSNISTTILLGITKFYKKMQANILYSHSGHDVTSYFRSDVIVK